jgi:SulP family sulfate permease
MTRQAGGRRLTWPRSLPVLQGLLPVKRSRIGPDVLAGVTLAAVGIPEVLGYARIAGMPLVTGLYTMMLPMVVFAVLGSSRHLVVAADSATAAILAAALVGLAAPGSPRYVQLAGLAALLTGGLLLLARLIRLSFLADFLSRTVLVGFLAGVGLQVAVDQLPDMIGVTVSAKQPLPVLVETVRAIPASHGADIAVSAGVIVTVLGIRAITRRVPGLLIAVILAIGASRFLDLAAHGAATVGAIPRGLPALGLPAFGRSDVTTLFGPSAAMCVVILAQSAATSRAYAAKYDEPLSIPDDLSALGAANAAAAFSGTFVVNGSPTKAQIVDSAGGRSQLSQLTAAAVVLVAAAFLTGPLAYLPRAALAAVVFLIAIELIDLKELRRILALRRSEFVVALITAAAVIVLGVEDGILLAVVASVVDHLRHSYNPRNNVLEKSPAGYWQPVPVAPGARTEDGLVIYRFGTSLYYANAARLIADLRALVDTGAPLSWFVFDCAAVEDIDYSAFMVLSRAVDIARQRDVRFAVCAVIPPVRRQLDGYGITKALGPDACYETARDALDAFHAANGHAADDAQSS